METETTQNPEKKRLGRDISPKLLKILNEGETLDLNTDTFSSTVRIHENIEGTIVSREIPARFANQDKIAYIAEFPRGYNSIGKLPVITVNCENVADVAKLHVEIAGRLFEIHTLKMAGVEGIILPLSIAIEESKSIEVSN